MKVQEVLGAIKNQVYRLTVVGNERDPRATRVRSSPYCCPFGWTNQSSFPPKCHKRFFSYFHFGKNIFRFSKTKLLPTVQHFVHISWQCFSLVYNYVWGEHIGWSREESRWSLSRMLHPRVVKETSPVTWLGFLVLSRKEGAKTP